MNNTVVAMIDGAGLNLEQNELASMLVEARKSARLSQAELARRMSVPTRLVEQWESGEAAPSVAAVNEFAAATGTSVRVSLVSHTTSESDATPPGDPCIMTVDEVAELLRLNRKTVYELVRQGKIPVRRGGRSLRANREIVMRWLSEKPAPRDGCRTRSARASRAGA